MKAALALALLAIPCAAQEGLSAAELKDKLYKVDRAIEQTEELAARSAGASYLAELRFRLCELTVEKSRYLFHLQEATRPAGETGALASPETRLLKEKAIAMYARLLREFPTFKDSDKVRFYLAHELRELGRFDEMSKTLTELVKRHPRSPLRLEAEQILGDQAFDQTDLETAEKHYRAVLEAKESPASDLARYKLGWIRVNQGKHAEALKYFEAAVVSPVPAGATKKGLEVKREALLDAVYSYTEVKPGKQALAYFERLSDSSATYALALEKLVSRFTTKEQPELAISALRRLLEIAPSAELDLERAQQLYDAVKETKGRVSPTVADVRYLVRAAVAVRKDTALDEKDRREQLDTLEQMARDLATQLHLKAQKKNEPRAFSAAADAYAEYLTLFRPPAQLDAVLGNQAEALFAARRFPEAAVGYEALAHRLDGRDPKGHETAAYGALLAHKSSLDGAELARRTALQRTDARQALKLDGQAFAARYPNNASVAEVQFNVARAYYDDGELKDAAERFAAFSVAHPDHKDAAVAGHLALDSWRQLKNFKALEDTGRQLLAAKVPGNFHQDVERVLSDVRNEALTEVALRGVDETGDVVGALLKVADDSPGDETSKKALVGALLASREKADFEKERELTLRLVKEYPAAPEAKDQLLNLAHRATETSRYADAAQWFEDAAALLPGNAGSEALESAARLRLAMGDVEGGAALMESAAKKSPALRRAALLAEVAEQWLMIDENEKAEAAAGKALIYESENVRAAAVLAEVAPDEAPLDAFKNAKGDAAARGRWYLAEASFDAYLELKPESLEKKIAALQKLQATYTRIAELGSPEWTVASLWRMGGALENLAQAVEAAPVPEQLDAENAAAYRQALAEKATPLHEQARQVFDTCLQRAESFEVFSDAVLGCRTGRSEVDPVAQLHRAAPCAGGKCAVPAELQKRVDRAKDAAPAKELGLGWLEQGQPGLARLALLRALELDDKNSSVHGALGWALVQLGDPNAAASEYRRALQTDPENARARASLAALKCRVGDKDGGKAELAQLKDKSVLVGADVDPDWKSCLDAVSRR